MDKNRLSQAIEIANNKFDGHLTIMKLTTNWKVAFGTWGERFEIQAMPGGKYLDAALDNLLKIFEDMDQDVKKYYSYMTNRIQEQEEEFERALAEMSIRTRRSNK